MTIRSALKLEMFDREKRAGFVLAIAIALFAVSITPLSVLSAEPAQESAPNAPAVGDFARPCKSTPSDAKPPKGARKDQRQKPADEDANAPGACIEVHSTAIEVQEYLQAQGREQKWNLKDERVAEDAWTFSRKLEREELLRYTKRDANTDRVDWTSGEAFIQVRTAELKDGFVRVQVSAHFQGHGQNPDRFAPPKDTWPLNSNATLENELISLLEKHFKSAQETVLP